MARVRELVPELGLLRRIERSMCFPLPRFSDIRYDYSLAGGSNMDAGAYTSDMLRQIAAASGDPVLRPNPVVNWARAKLIGPDVDRTMEAELVWENQCSGHIVNSLWSWRMPGISVRALGERGQLIVTNPVLPHYWHRIHVKIEGKTHQERVSGKARYYYQLQEFERRIRLDNRRSRMQTRHGHLTGQIFFRSRFLSM